MSSHTTPALRLRPARAQDLPRLASILISSFPADPEWLYRFPHAAQFPEDHYTHTLRRVEDYFANTQQGVADMVLAEIASPSAESKIAGFAAWQNPGSHGTTDGDQKREMKFPSTSRDRRDADHRHVELYSKIMHSKKTSMFDEGYGERQAHLCLLGVDPVFQGMGVGSALVEDGIEKARKGGYVLTLFATGPGGRRLYAKKGFQEVGWVEVGPIEGEEEALGFPGMVWKDEKRG